MRESALKVDCGRTIPCRIRESNLHQWRASPMQYQLNSIPTPKLKSRPLLLFVFCFASLSDWSLERGSTILNLGFNATDCTSFWSEHFQKISTSNSINLDKLLEHVVDLSLAQFRTVSLSDNVLENLPACHPVSQKFPRCFLCNSSGDAFIEDVYLPTLLDFPEFFRF